MPRSPDVTGAGPARPLEVIVLIGLPASGKSTFHHQWFSATHLHVSKDLMPNVRHKQARQQAVITAALEHGESVLVDNTNVSAEERAEIITVARAHSARVVGCWFPPDLPVLLARNARREGRARVPDIALFATLARLDEPRLEEGFDRLFVVRTAGAGGFVVRRFPDPGGWPSSRRHKRGRR